MDKEFKQLLNYCKDNGIKVTFTDSKVLYDYGAMNPEAATKMGFPKIHENEIKIDKTLSEETQIKTLKHELTEWRLMDTGIEYWPAHLIALKAEKQPFNFEQPMFAVAEPEQKGNFFARHFMPHKAKNKEKSRRQNRRQMARNAREYQAGLKRSR